MHMYLCTHNTYVVTCCDCLRGSPLQIGYVTVHYFFAHVPATSWTKFIWGGRREEAETARREREAGKHTASGQLVADLNSTAQGYAVILPTCSDNGVLEQYDFTLCCEVDVQLVVLSQHGSTHNQSDILLPHPPLVGRERTW